MEDHRICIKFCVKNGFKGAEIFWMLQTAYGDAVMSRRRVFEWYKRFKESREETADNERSGRPSTSTTPEKLDKVLELVREDRRITVREDILGVRRLNAVLVPKDFTFDQKNARKETASLNLEATTDDPELLKRIITGDETWIYGFDSETTQQASEWRFKNELRPKKARKAPSKVKVMLTVFFDYPGIVHHEFQQQGSTITADFYLGVLRFVALTRKQRHLATDIGLGLPHPVREWIRPAAGRQSKYPPTNQGRVGDTAVPSRQEKKPRGSLPKMTSGNFGSLVDMASARRSRHAKKILQAASCRRNDVEENPTSRVTWTERRRRKSHEQSFVDGKGRIGVSLKQRLEDGKRHLDNQRVVTIRQPTRDNWTSRQEKAKPATVLPRAGRDRFKGNMEEMDAIKKRRKAIRGTFTRIINEINGEFEKSQIDKNDIYSKFNRLESYYTKLVDLNEKYQALLVVKEGITEESIDREWQECDKYEEEKFDIQQKVSVLRNPDKEETIPIASEDTVINVKLPELALKSYDGSLECWLPWWAQFSKIHENNNLSDSDRFLYLRQAIVPNSEAYRVVASYPVTGANYVLAVQALQERFGDPNILTELYVRRLLNSVISNVKRESRNLSSLYDELSSHLRSLETLGIDPQLSGIFLYPLVESSLPSDILKIWHRHPSSGYGMELAKREESDKGVGGAQERLRLLLDFLKAEKGTHTESVEYKNCGRNHLEVLCEGNSSNRLTKPGRENPKENATEPVASLSSQACTGQVLLMTTVALLRGPNASRRVRILLDSGSQFSYIKQSLVWSIGIERKGEITIAKSLFGGNKIGEEKHGKFMLELENLGNKRDVIHIEALDQRKICDAIPPLPKGDWLEKLKIKGIILSQDNFKGQEIDILIGANYLGMILTGKIVQVEADLTAVETKLGWTLMGNSPIIDSNDNVQQTLNLLTTRCDLKDLWDLEVLGIRDPVETCSKETRYQEIKEKFITKIQRQSDQRYSVGLPWKVEKESIPSNLDIAIKRLDISTKKMTSQNKLTEYSQIFRDWLTEGLIERVEENPLERRGYYLPHRPVYKMESKTTPIRPVFDASCLGHNGLSLNQCLEKGPNLLERIPEMMIRFRENKFGVTADIRKAFQMVAIEESERNYLRFLWWEKESDRELIAYRHKRLVFGLNCSPFVLNAVIEYHLQSIRGPLVQWAKILAQSFYMDNCITSLETKQEVQEFQKAAIEIMDRAKMDLREWEYSLEENPEKGTCTKILGVVWNKMEDSLKCELPDNLSIQPKLTKRLVLSMVQRIFDPLGFCAPVFLTPKLLLQRSWGLKLGWDTPLPESMAQEFRTWLDQIKLIELIKIPRYMWNDLIFPTEVHIFCDASQIGYGAVAYLRSETGRENTLTLIWSKVRLAPMKSITIPRLELMAMVLGARLANAIQAALKRKCETTLWSDSTTALSWIKREIEWRVFVRNRVREIQATTNLNDWRFVPSQLNPADLLSRGCPPSQFVQSRWWEGPEWLKKPKEFWPNSEFSINLKRMFWPKGRIVNLIPGKDGIVRVAHVETSTGTLIRALQRLHPLEISSKVETIQKGNSNTEPQSEAFLGNRPNIESRDSRNRYGRVIRKPARRSRHAKKILQAASCRRNDVEENPTSRVTWTERRRRKSHEQSFVDGKGRIGVSLKQRLEDGKRHLDNQRVVTIRQPTRDNWTSRQEKAKPATVLPRDGAMDDKLILKLHPVVVPLRNPASPVSMLLSPLALYLDLGNIAIVAINVRVPRRYSSTVNLFKLLASSFNSCKPSLLSSPKKMRRFVWIEFHFSETSPTLSLATGLKDLGPLCSSWKNDLLHSVFLLSFTQGRSFILLFHAENAHRRRLQGHLRHVQKKHWSCWMTSSRFLVNIKSLDVPRIANGDCYV
ncbi:hypothetical protein LAZ67_3004710 [Cordylochernes scorpioides]|uniref:Uncharacterized protein n=1 Tax=Cordylochernes scorpioides TaxID=51811 RepID=A0ABY6K9M5_9ARAC|nr:hypothetical protein LAZ67_3004710 [Cordylochernes scorpioides]